MRCLWETPKERFRRVGWKIETREVGVRGTASRVLGGAWRRSQEERRVGKRGALSEWSRASRRRGISLRNEYSELVGLDSCL